MVGAAFIVIGVSSLVTATGLWGHLYTVMAGPELGFALEEIAPCLVSDAGLCSYPLCGDPVFAFAQRASDFFWVGMGLSSLGLLLLSLRLDGKKNKPPAVV